jgi:uncharacterized protein YdeI (YjbR/CyaY-like superfamily)
LPIIAKEPDKIGKSFDAAPANPSQMSKTTVVEYILKSGRWESSLNLLREILLDSELEETLQNQKKGKEIKPDFNKPIIIPEELKIEFSNDPWLRDAFNSLSKSMKRQYTQHINRAKQSATRERRLKKVIQLIKASRSEG